MKEKNTFAICIPTLNRIDLLFPALLYYSIDFPNTSIYIWDNGRQRIHEKLQDFVNIRSNRFTYPANLIDKLVVLGGNDRNIGVSAAWNSLLRTAFDAGHTHALVLNDDIYLGKNEFHINSLINNDMYTSHLYLCEKEFDWSVFIMPKNTFDTVGEFDESLVIYYSDNDYHNRLKMPQLNGIVMNIPFLNPAIFNRSMSLLKCKDEGIKKVIQMDESYYEKKWGGRVSEEKFTAPFGR